MRKYIAVTCVMLGVLCIMCSTGLIFYNRWEGNEAANSARSLLESVHSVIDENKIEIPLKNQDGEWISTQDEELLDDTFSEMQSTNVNDEECIGILSVPVLELELPVLTDWSYAKLKKAPCHYYGSYYEDNFVIAAHNYTSHFGRLSLLQAGDKVIFTDVNGIEHYYEVILLETLSADATNEMITSGFDLTLYTCTLGGDNRITVRCNVVDIVK